MATSINSRKAPQEESQLLNQDIVWIKNKLNTIDKDLQRLNNAVTGDRAFGQIGIIQRIDEHEKSISEFKTLKNKIIGASVVIGVVWTGVWTALSKYLFKAF
jgi:hypothetical protein